MHEAREIRPEPLDVMGAEDAAVAMDHRDAAVVEERARQQDATDREAEAHGPIRDQQRQRHRKAEHEQPQRRARLLG